MTFLLSAQDRAEKSLASLVATLDPILSPHGFLFWPGDSGVSSGGGFSNGHYKRAGEEIGLIYRGSALGCPNYVSGRYGTGHHELMRELGRADDCALWFDDALDKWRLVARNSLAVEDALMSDLSNIVLPTLENTPAIYSAAIQRAQEKLLRRLKGHVQSAT